MGKERKCILCHITYNSKMEMDEHMRSMLHHRELENLKGRDCKHECRICKVTVVGLSAYAKHISSQLHKEKVDAQEREENQRDDGKDEEYFDKELVQLIQQRKEEKGKNDTTTPWNRATENDDRQHRRPREDRQVYPEPLSKYNPSPWHHEKGECNWDWESRDFGNSRSSSFQYCQWKTNPGAPSKWHPSRGTYNWHSNGSGGTPQWYSKYNWHSNGSGGVSGWHPQSQTGPSNWNTNASNKGDSPSQYMTSRPNPRFQPSVLKNKGKLHKLNKKETKSTRDRHAWEKTQSWRRAADGRAAALAQRDCGDRWNLGDYTFQGYHMDFTRDDVPSEGMLRFDQQENNLSKEDQNGGKCLSPSRDKRHRWAPYRSHKSAEVPMAARDPGTKCRGSDDSRKGSASQKLTELEKQHEGNAASVLGKTSGELSGCKSSPNQRAGTSENGIQVIDFEGSQVPAAIRTKSFPPPEFTPCASSSDSKENKSSCSTESGKCLSKPGLETRGCCLVSNATLQPNSPLRASGAPLSTQSSLTLTIQPSLDVSNSAGKYQVDSSLSEELRRAREALRCSQTEAMKHSQREACTESAESNWKNSSAKTACTSPPAAATTDPIKPEAQLGGEEISEEDFTNISEEIKQTICVDSASICSGQEEPSSNPLKQDMATLYSQTGDGENCELSAAKRACKATSAAGTSVRSPTTLSFAVIETKSDNEIQSITAYGKTGDNCSSDSELQNGGSQNSNHLLSELNKLGLPTSLQRDLTRHINAKSRPGTHVPEPNLNIARRIRSIGSQRKSESEKESGLKPTLRQLLNVSRRHVNWDQVIQQVAKKKQELGKGLPRFGIEMVPSMQTGLEALELDEDENLSSLEGFQWEGISITPNGTVRKRSLSESSVVTDRRSIYSLFGDEVKDSEGLRSGESAANISNSQLSPVPLGPNSTASWEKPATRNSPAFPSPVQFSGSDNLMPDTSTSTQGLPSVKTEQASDSPLESECVSTTNSGQGKKCPSPTSDGPSEQNTATGAQKTKAFAQQSSLAVVSGPNAAEGATDSSYTSGGELNDTQTLGKKRRATTDVLSPEVPCLERKNKRRKLKSKRERCQVDQLLNISLREDELNKALQGLDGNLLQARAALQAAYIEVQKLLVLKQQITLEMSTLRSKRIEILQGLQESYDPTRERQPLSLVSERSSSSKLQVGVTELNFQTPFSPPLLTKSFPCPSSISQPRNGESAPALQTSVEKAKPDTSIKQEPVSPKGTEENVKEPWAPSSGLHSASSSLTGAHGKGEMRPLGFPLITLPPPLQHLTEGLSPLGPGEVGLPADQSRNGTEEAHGMTPPAFRLQRGAETRVAQHRKSFAVPEQPNPPPAGKCRKEPKLPDKDRRSQASEQVVESSFTPSESKGIKKKKKLRKKKPARVEQAGENSDTEQDNEQFRPTRKLKSKRMLKGKVTTSTPQESEGISAPREKGGPKGESEMASASTDSDSSVGLVEIPKAQLDVVDVESVELASEQSDSPCKGEQLIPSQCPTDTPKAGCNEVTSTSEVVTAVTKSVAETQTPGSSLKGSRNTSEVSSDGAEDDNPSEGIFEGHQASVNAMQIYNGHLYTCSADKTVRIYNLMSRKCVGLFEGHTTKVNCLLIVHIQGKTACLYTGSSDHTVRCYDVKSKMHLDQFTLPDRVLSLHSRWRILYIGLANGSVYSFSVKTNKQLDVFDCHAPRAVSCLATAQEGARRLLLVGSYDCTISVRDARNGLLLRTLEGHTKTVLCMKVVNDLVFSGSSDQSVHAHNIHTGELVRIYKGHNHAVTVVNILGKVMVTACLDKLVRVYELQSHDRLQVYGGHKDMLMCMVIHKSMIYTGCYDGSIQAVRLNLMQNYRCWWSGCTLIFGVLSHLKHHLLSDHHNPSFQTLKCRWRNCDGFFSVKNGSKQDVPKHLCEHAEENSQLDP
ncbi:zinc finger protein 106 isoform X2 [Stegostoma tigrinum]|uniref:zinc finger protein 106 isoform X2 n=1 Tax=Stegostoma tigrinum TaxID=3053191 RepID=UPI00202B96FB|nr:zinc finger protein 106 isoform X2 [Stegostoma tigrinum]